SRVEPDTQPAEPRRSQKESQSQLLVLLHRRAGKKNGKPDTRSGAGAKGVGDTRGPGNRGPARRPRTNGTCRHLRSNWIDPDRDGRPSARGGTTAKTPRVGARTAGHGSDSNRA